MAAIPLLIQAQKKPVAQKYPSLLWEISGNGLKKPSYLFGTMHVSSKIAFNLADSFYLGIRNANVVALETNPESWQEDMSKYDLDSDDGMFGNYGTYMTIPNEYLSINTLKFFDYDKKIERSLYSNPSTINNLLYRSYGESSDFEEDTYLDMYIYQCGKKWGKNIAGVENYRESMVLMQEAYKDAAKDKNKKQRSYDVDEDYSMDKLQESYRMGNLDRLDSINKLNSFSDAFDEKFLYKRNEIQAKSIDSILKKQLTLFVGVGAAHLPGQRGVIEMLRDMGYKLRPVMMGKRDNRHKEQVEKIRVPVTFHTETSDDGFFKVNIPGKFFKFGDDASLDQRQYADMANGSYYMVTRVMTNGWMWGHDVSEVYKKIDSLLYENIPGKIISKTKISRQGYHGFDITNKTRRGDIQRYNIYVTPFEILFFKMSGNGDYVSLGEEANKFFSSIQFKEYKGITDWKKYSPPTGGFAIDMPQQPFMGNDGSWIFDAEDKTAGVQYRLVRSDIHNYNFVEEDSFDLSLMEESFSNSEFIDTQTNRAFYTHKGLPALNATYRDKKGKTFLVRFIIQGPHYYTLIAAAKQVSPKMEAFLNSFEIKPFVYGNAVTISDTSLFYSVKRPVFSDLKKEKLGMPGYGDYGLSEDNEAGSSPQEIFDNGVYRNHVIANDTTGEKILVSFYRSPKYYQSKDSTMLDLNSFTDEEEKKWITLHPKSYTLPNGMVVKEAMLTDSGSSRGILLKRFYKDGYGFEITTLLDTLTPRSAFVSSFFETFTPADTLKGLNPFTSKSKIFFEDFMSADSLKHRRAVKYIGMVEVDSTDLPALKMAIQSLSWQEKKYLETKGSLIEKLQEIKTKSSADYLRQLYFAAADTIELQYQAIETLLEQQTAYSFQVFREILNVETPVLEVTKSSYDYSSNYKYSVGNGAFIDDLYDSLQLTHAILPDLLPLVNLDDYKEPIMRVLGRMIDSSLVSPKEYDMYYSKFLIEAKQAIKKQSIAEKRKAIEKAEESKSDEIKPSYLAHEQEDDGNDDLDLYATLLLPFWNTYPAVPLLVNQMLASNDKKLKYSTLLLVMRNNRSYPDSLLTYFAGLDEYRYKLYTDLKSIGESDKFPAKYNNHIDLGRSSLLSVMSYSKPDTIIYVDRLPAAYKGRKGFIYFYKYRSMKDDAGWKLATVGLVPEDPALFEFSTGKDATTKKSYSPVIADDKINEVNFTAFLETRLNPNENQTRQLEKELKKQLYSKRNSARNFYKSDNARYPQFHLD
jgi:uncharacterized protein YbaP (TraB family)